MMCSSIQNKTYIYSKIANKKSKQRWSKHTRVNTGDWKQSEILLLVRSFFSYCDAHQKRHEKRRLDEFRIRLKSANIFKRKSHHDISYIEIYLYISQTIVEFHFPLLTYCRPSMNMLTYCCQLVELFASKHGKRAWWIVW